MISLAKASGADYFLAVNPDMLLEKDSIGCLMAALNADGSLGSVSPKILKWLFGRADGPDGGRTQIIDSLGIALISGLRFVDIGQGVMEWEADKHVQLLGPSGAAGLYRMSALESSRLGNDYFDSGMFMYKEDCDLAYRLFLSGWKSEMVPEAIVYHDRSAAVAGKGWQTFMANRRAKGRLVNAWSLENQLVIYRRYWRLQSIGAKIKIIIDVTKAFVFASLREPYLLKSFYKAAFKRITPYGERS
jgi:GT2 family glycosyltransferase